MRGTGRRGRRAEPAAIGSAAVQVSGGSRPMERVLVVGLSGSGKSTMAAELARLLGVPHVELDALFWEPGWTEAEAAVFAARVEERTAGGRWVVCGNYWSKLGPYLWPRADTVVWLDLPFWLVEVRSVRRTLVRSLRRTELWGGNRERLRNVFTTDSLWRFNLKNAPRLRARYEEAMAEERWSGISFHRLCTRRQVRDWLAELAAGRAVSAAGDGAAAAPAERPPA
jgi:adenylate kinase family enzyme